MSHTFNEKNLVISFSKSDFLLRQISKSWKYRITWTSKPVLLEKEYIIPTHSYVNS